MPESDAADGFRLGHRPFLDGLRGVAVLAVLGVHSGVSWLPGGFLGVDLFFVLSGFLITALLLEERRTTGTVSLGRFYARRALRLLPATVLYVVACGVTAYFGMTVEDRRLFSDGLPSVLLYFLNWRVAFEVPIFAPFVHLWSLSVEEQFYLFWPPLFLWLAATPSRGRWLMALTIFGIVAPAVLRVLLWTGPTHAIRLYCGTDARADALLAGCLLAQLLHLRKIPAVATNVLPCRAAAWMATAVLAVHFSRCGFLEPYVYFGGFSVVLVAAGVLLTTMLVAPSPILRFVLEIRPLRWIGRMSYGVYVFHLLVFLHWGPWVAARIPSGWTQGLAEPATVILATKWAVALGVAAASYALVETPFLRLKDRFRPPARRPLPEARVTARAA